MNANEVLFMERQRLSLRALIFTLVREGRRPPGLNRMTTVVTPRFLDVHEGPRRYETWRIEDLAACEPVYKSAAAGGRGAGTNMPGYTLRGGEGVVVTLTSGRRFLIGSERPQELYAAIHRARSEGPLYRGT